jgi:hypothetical protein
VTDQRFCAFCGSGIVPGGTFCVKCGQSVAAPAAPAGVPAAAPVAPAAPAPAPAATQFVPTTQPWAAVPPGVVPTPAPPASMAPPSPAYPSMAPPAWPGAGGPSVGGPSVGGPPAGPGMVYTAPPRMPPGQFPSGLAAQRPTGVTILAILAGIGALLGLWGGYLWLQWADYVEGAAAAGTIIMVVSLAWIAVAYGLWMGRPWAWMATGAVAGVSLALQLLAFFNPNLDKVGALFQIAVNGAILYYLNTPGVRQAFGRS